MPSWFRKDSNFGGFDLVFDSNIFERDSDLTRVMIMILYMIQFLFGFKTLAFIYYSTNITSSALNNGFSLVECHHMSANAA